MQVKECYLPDMAVNGYFRSITYDVETRTGRLDFGPYVVAYDKATSVWMIRAIDPQVRRVEVTAGCGDACYVLGEKGHWRTLKTWTPLTARGTRRYNQTAKQD